MQHKILPVSHHSSDMRPQGFRFAAGNNSPAALHNRDPSHSPRVECKWHSEDPPSWSTCNETVHVTDTNRCAVANIRAVSAQHSAGQKVVSLPVATDYSN